MTMKNINKLWNVALVLCLFLTVNCKNDVVVSEVQVENNDETSETTVESTEHVEPFIPTKEWQIIKPNQAIPKGLHVRINFQTGLKEAKILETDGVEDNASCPKKDKFSEEDGDSCNEKKGPKIVLGEEIKQTQNDDKIYFTKDQLKDALHEFRDKVGVNDVPDATWSPDAKKALEEEQLEHEKQVKKKFRSMDEIKAELKDSLNMDIKSDVQVMKQLVQVVIADNSSVFEKVEALDNLEYYVHQVDNAVDLDKIGGLEPVVLLLNSTEREVQEKSAVLVAAAVQNNKEVKKRVLKYGGLRLLLQLVHPEKEVSIKKKAIFALSALTRDFPNACNELISSNGVKGIIHIIKDSSAPSFLRVKAIDFFFGLLREQNKSEEGKIHTIGHMIEENDLCGVLVPLLKSGDFSQKEKLMDAIKISIDVCRSPLKESGDIKDLVSELDELDRTIGKEDDEEFKSYLEGLRKDFKMNVIDRLLN